MWLCSYGPMYKSLNVCPLFTLLVAVRFHCGKTATRSVHYLYSHTCSLHF